MEAYLGYDPGGRDANAVALLIVDGTVAEFSTALVNSVDAGVAWCSTQLNGREPIAIGVDAFLFWETGPGGWRACDKWLRERYPRVRNSVLSSNSATGSMSIQGMAFAIAARQIWPEAQLIEAHPKVLYFARRGVKYSWEVGMTEWLKNVLNATGSVAITTDHEWDALFSAWAAYQGARGRWPMDLRQMSESVIEPAGPVRYWWPD